MRYPYLESHDNDWDYRALYYGSRVLERRSDDSRADVDSEMLRFADVLVDITRLGGDPDDQVDAILYWVAGETAREMRVGSVLKHLDLAGALWSSELGDALSRRLADRAASILRGAALVGALRAIAWHLAQSSRSSLRADLIRQARDVVTETGMTAGHSTLLADDAHAHLRLSEMVREGHEDIRDLVARIGTLLLGAALAHAIQEPWDPFVRSRMSKERIEHHDALERVMTAEPPIRAAFEGAVRILEESGREGQAEFDAMLCEVGPAGDLEAFFWSRQSQKPVRRPELLDPTVLQFVHLETELRRFV